MSGELAAASGDGPSRDELCLNEGPPQPLVGYLCTEPKGHPGTHRCEYGEWPNRTWDDVSADAAFVCTKCGYAGPDGPQHTKRGSDTLCGYAAMDVTNYPTVRINRPADTHSRVDERDLIKRLYNCLFGYAMKPGSMEALRDAEIYLGIPRGAGSEARRASDDHAPVGSASADPMGNRRAAEWREAFDQARRDAGAEALIESHESTDNPSHD